LGTPTKSYLSIKDVHRETREQQQFGLDEKGLVVVRTLQSDTITYDTLFSIANSSGFLVGEVYDEIAAGLNLSGKYILDYYFAGITQFQIELNIISQKDFTVKKLVAASFLLQENGDIINLEDDGKLLIQG
jgi:hypothetical protein